MSQDQNQQTVSDFIEPRDGADLKTLVVQYAVQILGCQLQIKESQNDIAAISDEAKEDGVPMGLVKKELNTLRANMKLTETERAERSEYHDILADNAQVKSLIMQLNTPRDKD